MFCSNFNLTTFSLMFFPLFSKVFTDILRIYELPKIYNKNAEILPNTSLNNNHLPDQFYLPTSSGFWAIPLLTLLKMCPGRQRTHFCGGRKGFHSAALRQKHWKICDLWFPKLWFCCCNIIYPSCFLYWY